MHAAALIAIAYLPFEIVQRFRTSGQRRVISFEMLMTPPTPSSIASEMFVETTHEPVELVAVKSLQPRPDSRHKSEASQIHYDSSESAEPLPLENPTNELPMRAKPPVEMPTVAEFKVARPRRNPSIAILPVVSAMPVIATAGLSPTEVEFESNPPPAYPAIAVANRIEGTVLLTLYVGRDGKVYRAEVLETSGSDLLDEAARTAVLNWSGKPATRSGQPVEVIEVLPVRFRL